MTATESHRSRIRRALRGNRGSVQDIMLLAIVGTILAAGVTRILPGSAAILTATGLQAERQSAIDAIVSDKRDTTTWGTDTAPAAVEMTLPSGDRISAATWATPGAGGITYHAAAPKVRHPQPGACQSASVATDPTCLRAELFRAYDATTLIPAPIARKDPSTSNVVGVIDPRVATAEPITVVKPQPTPVATLSTSTPRAWRYLIKAAAATPTAELRFLNGSTVLATIPLDAEQHDYFGTIPARPGGAITLQVTDGAAVVTSILIYDAGALS